MTATKQEMLDELVSLGVSEVDGKDKDDFTADELEAMLAKAQAPAQDEPAKVYTLADKKAITTRRGIKGPGETVTVDDIGGGKAALDVLVEKGFFK